MKLTPLRSSANRRLQLLVLQLLVGNPERPDLVSLQEQLAVKDVGDIIAWPGTEACAGSWVYHLAPRLVYAARQLDLESKHAVPSWLPKPSNRYID